MSYGTSLEDLIRRIVREEISEAIQSMNTSAPVRVESVERMVQPTFASVAVGSHDPGEAGAEARTWYMRLAGTGRDAVRDLIGTKPIHSLSMPEFLDVKSKVEMVLEGGAL